MIELITFRCQNKVSKESTLFVIHTSISLWGTATALQVPMAWLSLLVLFKLVLSLDCLLALLLVCFLPIVFALLSFVLFCVVFLSCANLYCGDICCLTCVVYCAFLSSLLLYFDGLHEWCHLVVSKQLVKDDFPDEGSSRTASVSILLLCLEQLIRLTCLGSYDQCSNHVLPTSNCYIWFKDFSILTSVSHRLNWGSPPHFLL